MSIFSEIADMFRAATDLVREVRPKADNPPLKRSHFPTTPAIGQPTCCLYCGKHAPWPANELCPAFH